MVLSLEAVDFFLIFIGHAGHTLVLLSVQLIHADLVCSVDFLNGLHVLLIALSLSLFQALYLSTQAIILNNELLLIASMLICIFSNLN